MWKSAWTTPIYTNRTNTDASKLTWKFSTILKMNALQQFVNQIICVLQTNGPDFPRASPLQAASLSASKGPPAPAISRVYRAATNATLGGNLKHAFAGL